MFIEISEVAVWFGLSVFALDVVWGIATEVYDRNKRKGFYRDMDDGTSY